MENSIILLRNYTLLEVFVFLFLFKILQPRRALQPEVVKKEPRTDSFLSQTLCVLAYYYNLQRVCQSFILQIDCHIAIR